MDDERIEVTSDLPTADELRSFHVLSKYLKTVEYLMRTLGTRTRFVGQTEPNTPEEDFAWTIVLLDALKLSALDQLIGTHELNREAHALIYEILDTMFPGRKKYSHQDKNLFTEYKDVLDHAVENPPAPMTGTIDWDTFDFVVDPERIRFLWKEAYDSCMPTLQKVAYKMKTWLLIVEDRAGFSGGEHQNSIQRHRILEVEYWTVREAQDHVYKELYPRKRRGDETLEMIRHKLMRAAKKGDILRQEKGTSVRYVKSSVLLWVFDLRTRGDTESLPTNLDDKDFD